MTLGDETVRTVRISKRR